MLSRPIKAILTIATLLILAVAPILAAEGLYVDDDKGFSIEFPAEWYVKKNFMQSEVWADSPPDANGLSLSIFISTEAVPPGVTLDTAFNFVVETIIGQYGKEMSIGEKGATNINGLQFRWFIIEAAQGQTRIKTITYITVSSNWIYAISAGGEAGHFDSYKPVLDQIIRTFRITSAPTSQPGELRVYTTGEEPRPTAPTPPPAKPRERATVPFKLHVEQGGQRITPVNGEITLSRAPFVLVLTLPEPGGVLVNISENPRAYQAAREGKPLAELPGFGRSNLVEGFTNTKRELILSDQDYQYWFYFTESINRFDRVVQADDGGIVCHRAVNQLYLAGKDRTIPLAQYEGKAIHLVFLQADRPALGIPPREYHRECLRIAFAK